MRGIVDAAFELACSALVRNRELLEAGARELLAKESLSGDDLVRLLARVRQDALSVKTAAA